ncbi:GtrA family protein [Cumulibacter manganitolerans]|uniref:GtrA family protein n=1 Tax=Cumulibacter manganitolerans TaxID=1884992 RepID=UPI001294F70A|nr:GtrA family protein [Cumulibacter manganitolerans]
MTAPIDDPVLRTEERARRLLWQFLRFLVAGLISFSVDYGVFVLLYRMFDVQYIVASTISFSLSLVLNYVLTLKFVFEAREGRSIAKEFATYVGLNMVALGLNQVILLLTVDKMGASPLVGKLIATAVVMVYNFISRKMLIERPGRRAAAAREGVTPPMEAGNSTT